MSLLEKQKAVISVCNEIYQHYMSLETMDWEKWWSKTEPYMESKFGSDEDISEFMRFQFRHVFRQLQVMRGEQLWPIKKD